MRFIEVVVVGMLEQLHRGVLEGQDLFRFLEVAVHAYDVVLIGSEDESISHTSETFLIGPDGDGVATFDHGTPPSEMAAEIRKHLEAFSGKREETR